MNLLLLIGLAVGAAAGPPACEDQLRAGLVRLRESLKPLAQADTAYDVAAYTSAMARGGYPLTEHCGCVATVVREIYGGRVFQGLYHASDGRASWHVFNRVDWDDCSYDIDLTKAQFGFAEDADRLRPPPLSDVVEIPYATLAGNSRLRRFLERYRRQLQSSNSPW